MKCVNWVFTDALQRVQQWNIVNFTKKCSLKFNIFKNIRYYFYSWPRTIALMRQKWISLSGARKRKVRVPFFIRGHETVTLHDDWMETRMLMQIFVILPIPRETGTISHPELTLPIF